jgi:hypothetical protein
VKGAAVVSEMSVEWIWLQILKKSMQFVNRTWCIFMVERVGDIFLVTSLQLEFQGYRLNTVVGDTGVTAGHTLKLPCAYCMEVRRTRESTLILSVHLNLRHTIFFLLLHRAWCYKCCFIPTHAHIYTLKH